MLHELASVRRRFRGLRRSVRRRWSVPRLAWVLTMLATTGCADRVTAPSAVGNYALKTIDGRSGPFRYCFSTWCDEYITETIELRADGIAVRSWLLRRTTLATGATADLTPGFSGVYTTSGAAITILSVSTNAMVGTVSDDGLTLNDFTSMRVYARQ
jgi:hypothetical protein